MPTYEARDSGLLSAEQLINAPHSQGVVPMERQPNKSPYFWATLVKPCRQIRGGVHVHTNTQRFGKDMDLKIRTIRVPPHSRNLFSPFSKVFALRYLLIQLCESNAPPYHSFTFGRSLLGPWPQENFLSSIRFESKREKRYQLMLFVNSFEPHI